MSDVYLVSVFANKKKRCSTEETRRHILSSTPLEEARAARYATQGEKEKMAGGDKEVFAEKYHNRGL